MELKQLLSFIKIIDYNIVCDVSTALNDHVSAGSTTTFRQARSVSLRSVACRTVYVRLTACIYMTCVDLWRVPQASIYKAFSLLICTNYRDCKIAYALKEQHYQIKKGGKLFCHTSFFI